jgi:glutamate mutase epsilon subunit
MATSSLSSLSVEELLRMQQQAQVGAFSSGLREVSDPEKAYADLTRQEYLDYVANYRKFEEQLIQKAQTDKTLIDQARADVGTASALTQGIATRNAERYGVALTPDQIQQQRLSMQRASTLGGIQAVNDAKIAQREANTALLSDLINIGQGVNRASQQQLGSAAGDATARRNAYTQAKAQSKANTYSTIGSLASAAILAFAF